MINLPPLRSPPLRIFSSSPALQKKVHGTSSKGNKKYPQEVFCGFLIRRKQSSEASLHCAPVSQLDSCSPLLKSQAERRLSSLQNYSSCFFVIKVHDLLSPHLITQLVVCDTHRPTSDGLEQTQRRCIRVRPGEDPQGSHPTVPGACSTTAVTFT